MKHLFVPYEIALQLKEKGFNEPCLGHFNPISKIGEITYSINEIQTKEGWAVSAPLYQQVIDWFRDKHNLAIGYTIGFPIAYSPHVQNMIQNDSNKSWGFHGGGTYYCDTYYEALNKAIEEALKLI